MKKIILLLLSLSILSACQNQAPLRQSSDETKDEKATSNSVVNINVQDPSSPAPTVLSNTRGIVYAEAGLAPGELSAGLNYDLMIFNSTDKSVDLYTTLDGEKPCPDLGASFSVASHETKKFKLTTAMTCAIMNQAKPTDKATLTVQ